MAGQDDRPTFIGEFANDLVDSRIEKRLLRGPVIGLDPLLPMCAFAFQTGLFLGHTFTSKALSFAVAFAMRSEVANEALASMMGEGLRELTPVPGRTKTPLEIVLLVEMASVGVEGEWADWLMQEANEPVPADTAVELIACWAIRGAGLALRDGITVVQVIADSYKDNSETLQEMREYSGIVGASIQNWTIESATKGFASSFLRFVAEFYPEYLDELSTCVPAQAA